MKVIRKEKSQLVLRFDRGEKYPETLIKFLKREKIRCGFFFGLGSLENPTIAYFDLKKEKYLKKGFKGVFELLSIVGNVSVLEGELVVHEHVVLGRRNYQTVGGHLIKGTIGGTLEIHFTILKEMKRKKNPKSELSPLIA